MGAIATWTVICGGWWVLCCAVFHRTADGTLISSSQLTQCVNRGSANATNSDEPVPCLLKFVVSMALDGGENGSEALTATWSTATGTQDGRPVVYKLHIPMTITVAKSPPLLRYPLTYRRSYNNKPRESVVYTGVLECKDSASDSNPTCGWAFGSDGQRIPYSQGFCCSCSLCQLIGVCSSSSRANTNCALLGNGASASCLTFDSLWYSGYSIGAPETFYTITVTVTQPGGIGTRTLVVGPEVGLGAADADSGVSVRLVGDFAAFQSPLSLSSRILLVPAAPSGNPRVVAPAPTEWLFVDTSDVDDTGTQCNKIGVSYEAFNGQGSRCQMSAGACLAGQIDDFRAQDLLARQGGHVGRYFVSNFGQFTTIQEAGGAQRTYLAYAVNNVQASLITLSFVADNISYSLNAASGRILTTNLTATFSANSADGVLTVTILNTGQVAADFYLTVDECTEGTFPVASQVLASVNPSAVRTATFQIRSEIVKGQPNTCNVTLKDALYQYQGSAIVRWNSTDQNVDKGPQGGTGNGANGTVLPPRQSTAAAGEGCSDCPWYNPLCFLSRQCIWALVLQVLAVLLLLIVVGCVVRNRRCLFGKCRTRSNDSRSRHGPTATVVAIPYPAGPSAGPTRSRRLPMQRTCPPLP